MADTLDRYQNVGNWPTIIPKFCTVYIYGMTTCYNVSTRASQIRFIVRLIYLFVLVVCHEHVGIRLRIVAVVFNNR